MTATDIQRDTSTSDPQLAEDPGTAHYVCCSIPNGDTGPQRSFCGLLLPGADERWGEVEENDEAHDEVDCAACHAALVVDVDGSFCPVPGQVCVWRHQGPDDAVG